MLLKINIQLKKNINFEFELEKRKVVTKVLFSINENKPPVRKLPDIGNENMKKKMNKLEPKLKQKLLTKRMKQSNLENECVKNIVKKETLIW